MSPADVGYMFGDRLEYKTLSADSTSFTFANDVMYTTDGTYILDTSDGQSISGTWADQRVNAAVKYHYFCTDGATSCDSSKIGYIHCFSDSSTIYYLNIAGYNDIEAAKAAMFANSTDSNAKATIEAWFESENLDGHIAGTRNFEDDLEDTVFCNDRSYYSGSLKGKDSDATLSGHTVYSYHSAYGRNMVNVDGNYHPSLDCTSKNDSFTKDDTTVGNGNLSHKIGLITDDEHTMAGYGTSTYLYSGQYMWSASPLMFAGGYSSEFFWDSDLNYAVVGHEAGLRPLVSLKSGIEFADNGADGTSTNPYIVE